MIFEFNWTSYEEYNPYLFEGKEKTLEEWKSDCQKAMTECFDEYMSSLEHFNWAMLPYWIEFALDKLETYGYKRFKPITFGYQGGFIPKEDDLKDEYKQMPELAEQIKCMQKYNTILENKNRKNVKKETRSKV